MSKYLYAVNEMSDDEFKMALATVVDYANDMARRNADDEMVSKVEALSAEAATRNLLP